MGVLILITLFSLICFAPALTVCIFHWVAALSLLPGVLNLAERVPTAFSLIILRLGVRIILLGVCHTSFPLMPGMYKPASCPMVALN